MAPFWRENQLVQTKKKKELGGELMIWKCKMQSRVQLKDSIDETLASSITENTQHNEKRRNKERGSKSEPEEQNPKLVTKGQRNKSCSKAPNQTICFKWVQIGS
jgi:hypothetical protein